ncbi:hypothetical protein TRFO_33277 [Tritrichomonas foetus]|uniref:Uncharacterized protein n=1 Tax=Tritrichomonas foetus TaxID=1144522 RepID=A0A1J4JM01_9EUKA|nr:hypothetical protein TRFO_33277 [Tritrichomonas foetus]|eukprot:OHT00145.1 hypothetical protein TRFO_33277 [Tritrichomonas foetus]
MKIFDEKPGMILQQFLDQRIEEFNDISKHNTLLIELKELFKEINENAIMQKFDEKQIPIKYTFVENINSDMAILCIGYDDGFSIINYSDDIISILKEFCNDYNLYTSKKNYLEIKFKIQNISTENLNQFIPTKIPEKKNSFTIFENSMKSDDDLLESQLDSSSESLKDDLENFPNPQNDKKYKEVENNDDNDEIDTNLDDDLLPSFWKQGCSETWGPTVIEYRIQPNEIEKKLGMFQQPFSIPEYSPFEKATVERVNEMYRFSHINRDDIEDIIIQQKLFDH